LNGLKTGTGVRVQSDEKSMRVELEDAIRRLRGEEGRVFRGHVERVRETFRRSMEEGGGSYKEMIRLGNVLMGVEESATETTDK
jgi:hypothetical protein